MRRRKGLAKVMFGTQNAEGVVNSNHVCSLNGMNGDLDVVSSSSPVSRKGKGRRGSRLCIICSLQLCMVLTDKWSHTQKMLWVVESDWSAIF